MILVYSNICFVILAWVFFVDDTKQAVRLTATYVTILFQSTRNLDFLFGIYAKTYDAVLLVLTFLLIDIGQFGRNQ